MPGKKLFDEQPSSEEEDSISASDPDDQDEEGDEEEEQPLIHSLRSSASKLQSMKVHRETKGPSRISRTTGLFSLLAYHSAGIMRLALAIAHIHKLNFLVFACVQASRFIWTLL